ncbi:MAG: plastocyanin/azurin family copper-binding protein [Planctomycetaceae bacterium]
MNRGLIAFASVVALLCPHPADTAAVRAADGADVLRRENLVAWCIVPFDANKRGPAERAVMLKELGILKCAYDWREEHVPTFEQEILEYRKQGIEYFAFWGVHDDAFRLFEKYDLHPQIWLMFADPAGETQEARVETAAQQLLPVARRTKAMGCKLGLYNHGGWSGEPKNLVAVCRRLRELGHDHVGVVYNFHHGHGHISDWAESFAMMKPFLHCLNLDGMNDNEQPKILGIGKGAHELEMIRTVVESGYDGPIGILDHREQLDAFESLKENRDGLEWVRREIQKPGSGGPKPAAADQKQASSGDAAHDHGDPKNTAGTTGIDLPYDAELVATLVSDSREHGDAARGAAVFANAKLACLSCHKVGPHGGTVGPELTAIAKDRELTHIVESILWPKRDVKPEFVTWQVVTVEGKVVTGYRVEVGDETITLKDPASGKLTQIAVADIEEQSPGTTVMPAGLTAAMSPQQQRDLIRFVSDLGRNGQPPSEEILQVIAHSQMHGAARFPFTAKPIDEARWPNSQHPVNRDRLYDFYTKQAEYFRQQPHVPMLLAGFPGLDGGQQGHWGNQNEDVWVDGRWNDTQLGSVMSGVFHADGLTIARGVCLRLGDRGEVSACFNPDTLTYDAIWTGGFVSFDSVRHGFVSGLRMAGTPQEIPNQNSPGQPFQYHGFYRHGNRVVFSYRIGDIEYLDSPWVDEGRFAHDVERADRHPLRQLTTGGPEQWPQVLETKIIPGNGRPYAVDTIELPYDNPWKAPMFCGDHDFLPDGSALVCTMQGDVWRVTGLDSGTDRPGVAQWRRFASGLHHALGLVVADGQIFVQCRDQLTRLTDLNGDGEADFYECFSNAFETSPAGHDFICGLQRDSHGNFYMASGNQGLVRISPDGKTADVISTGFRNPDGLGLLPDGTVTVPTSEGEWTPASSICAVRNADGAVAGPPPHFGYRGPIDGKPPELPIVYLPRGLDNSSGGQAYVDSDRFGPLQGQLTHFSFGAGSWFLVLRDEVDGQMQGAAVLMAGDFLSGVHRGRFRPTDGQLYVSGMAGWGSYTRDDGSFQRVRYTGDAVQVPVGFHVHENGVRVTFSQPLDAAVATDPHSHFVQCWNYRYSAAYGSVDYSTTHPGVSGHDPLTIASTHMLADGRSLFLELPDLQPVNQLHLRLHVNKDDHFTCNPSGHGHDLLATVHKLDKPFTEFPGYVPHEKTIAAHPLLADLALSAIQVPNPWRYPIKGARSVEVETGKNLTYAIREFTVNAGEPIAFTLKNPDVVPHNWVLVKAGALQRVGELGNRLIADPEAYARQYIPETDDILAHTDIVSPGEAHTIYFKAPETPGRYPYLCTFPGHWMVMNGTLVVE